MSDREESPSGQISSASGPNQTETRLKSSPATSEGASASGEKNRTTLSDIEAPIAPPVSRRLVLVAEGDEGSVPPPPNDEQSSAVEDEPSRPSLVEADELVGQMVDARYRIESVAGIGSMGIVYVARHLAVKKRVALKVLRQQFVEDVEVTQRFAAEATAATAIGNAHIVDTLDFGKLPNGSAYQVMEFLDGQTLSEALRREKPMPLERILQIARQVAVALGAAHEAGIVHRDLKPDNVFLVVREASHDFVKILDFGIAKFGAKQSDLTHAGAVFGTPNYMAPEQALGKPTSAATDIYALGVILYEMASGDVPFRGESPIAVLTRHATEAPAPLSKHVPGVALRFERLVLRCLEKEPSARFPNMAALIAELDAVSAGAPLPGPIVSPAPSRLITAQIEREELELLRPKNRSSGLIAALVLAGLVGAGYGGFKLREAASAPSASASVVAPPPAVSRESVSTNADADKEKTRDVALVLFPLDAHVVVGDKDLGAMPVTVKVPEGRSVFAEVRRDGYWTRKLRLDGSKSRIVVGLVKREGNAAPAPSAAAAAPDDAH
ncbi:MAG TPA: serine/threonine-protein kinase [Polyangiaceae bacterium]|jgi:serine/threonine-protein kinase|nr:serine/threonine-protein kinase [Polyangiaceae bacterium]